MRLKQLPVLGASPCRTTDDAWPGLIAAPVLALGNMRDIVEGRLSESEMEIGAVIRLAKTLGVPCLTFLYASLLPQESKARGIIHFPDAKSSPFNTPDAVLLP